MGELLFVKQDNDRTALNKSAVLSGRVAPGVGCAPGGDRGCYTRHAVFNNEAWLG